MSEECPIIAVIGPDRGGEAAWQFTRFAVWLAGGHAVRVTPLHPRTLEHVQGLILGGGADIDPVLYDERDELPIPKSRSAEQTMVEYLLGFLLLPMTFMFRKLSGLKKSARLDTARDALEMKLLDEAVKRRLPVLGICRGQQLINVYFGGSLYRNLVGFYIEDPEVRTILPRKWIELTAGTKLARSLGRGGHRVNALHYQGINSLGRELVIAARDRNGIVQAIEHRTAPFIIGVQWHPEFLPQLSDQRRLFRAMVKHAHCEHSPAVATNERAGPLEIFTAVEAGLSR